MPSTSIIGRCLFLLICSLGVVASLSLAEEVSFDRDVLPILSDNCFQCHGPDQKARQAGLRLDLKSSALRQEKPIIQAGDIENSRLIDRITDPSQPMPPL